MDVEDAVVLTEGVATLDVAAGRRGRMKQLLAMVDDCRAPERGRVAWMTAEESVCCRWLRWNLIFTDVAADEGSVDTEQSMKSTLEEGVVVC